MARSYIVDFNLTSPNSATLPILNVLATTAVRPRCYELEVGSPADASNAGDYAVRRCSTAGTPNSNPTPAPVDPSDPASTSTAGLATFSAGPTLGTTLLHFGLNQRATMRWLAAPGKELVAPATANNGLCFMNPSVSGVFTISGSFFFEE